MILSPYQQKASQARQMVFGVLSTCAYNSMLTFTNFIPNRLSLLSSTAWKVFEIPTIMLRTDIIPMFWAIGFITGHLIAIPLTIAVIAKFVLIAPAHLLFFNQLTSHDYILAFGTGMALQGALLGFWSMVKMIKKVEMNIRITFLLAPSICIYYQFKGFSFAQFHTHSNRIFNLLLLLTPCTNLSFASHAFLHISIAHHCRKIGNCTIGQICNVCNGSRNSLVSIHINSNNPCCNIC